MVFVDFQVQSFVKNRLDFLLGNIWKKQNVLEVPKQSNNYDCGVFLCVYADYIAREGKFDFTKEDMKYFRKKIYYEISIGALIPF